MKKAFVLASALFAALSAAVLPAWALDDISGHEYEQMIEFLNEEGIISGYPDGTFKPDNPVNRVEFLRVVLESSQDSIPEAEGDCGFNDVEAGAWYMKYVCKAAELEIVAGYPDGSFKPSQQVTFVEAAKIAALGYDFELEDFAEDVEWYVPYVSMASENLFIPPDVDKLDKPLTRGQISEFLGRSVKYKEGDLVDYLEGVEMDYVLFDMDEFVLSVADAVSDIIEQLLEDLTSDMGGVVDVDTGDVEWIVNSDGVLGEGILYGSDDLSGYYQVTAENPDVLTGEVVGGSEDGNYFKIDLKPQETGLSFDYSGSDGTIALSSWIDGVISLGTDDVDETVLPEGTNYTQSLTATWPNSEIIYSASKDAFSEHIVNETGPVLYRSDLGDGVYSESLEISDEGLDFTYESEDKDGDGILKNSENWIYIDPYGTYLISQTIEDDYYYELFKLNLGDSTMELVYSDDNYYENFGLEDDSVGMGLAISMSGGDASETFVYDDGEIGVEMSITDIGTTDFTMALISDEGNTDGDVFLVDVADNEVSNVSYSVTDGNAEMVVSYNNYGDGYEAMDGVLYIEEFAHQIFEDGFVSTEVAMGEFGFEGEKITVSTEGISLNSDFGTLEAPIAICDETGSWVLGEGKLTWKKMMEDYLAGQAKKAEGSFDWGKGGYISGFDVDLDLGDDEEEVDEASADGEDFKWNKKMKLSLNPFSSSYDGTILGPNLVGEQSGKVKGRGLNKWWKFGLGLDIDLDLGASASVKPKAEQDFTYTNGKFKKDHSSYTNALTWEIMQKFGADWVIGGANVKKENTTSLINGVLNGEQEININAGDFGKEMVSEYGTGKLFRVGQEVDFNLPGQGKKSITVTAGSNNRLGYEQTMSWPLDGDSIFGPGSGWSGGVSGWGGYDGHIWRGGAGLTGQHSSGFTVDVSVEKGEGGKPTVSVGFGWKF